MAGQWRRDRQWATCPACGKRGFFTRRDARNGMRAAHGGRDGMSVYECPGSPGVWHYGHLSPRVRSGELARADVYERRAS